MSDPAGRERAHAELAHARPEPTELVIKKSVFLTRLARVHHEDEARALIAEVRHEHPPARHHCMAFVLGPLREVQRSSDDGEPAGTAGVPMLSALLGHTVSGLPVTHLVAVCSRWFGGIKLGAGGLTRAYSGSVTAALDAARWRRRSRVTLHDLSLDHADIGRVETSLRASGVTVLDQRYEAATAWLQVAVPPGDHERVANTVAQLTSGGTLGVAVGERWITEPIRLGG